VQSLRSELHEVHQPAELRLEPSSVWPDQILQELILGILSRNDHLEAEIRYHHPGEDVLDFRKEGDSRSCVRIELWEVQLIQRRLSIPNTKSS